MSWTSYFQDTDAVILVVDSTDRMRTALVKARVRLSGSSAHHTVILPTLRADVL